MTERERADISLVPFTSLVRMHTNVRRDLTRLSQPDHVHGRGVSSFCDMTGNLSEASSFQSGVSRGA